MPVEKIPSWIKQVLMPELTEIKGKLEAINTRIDSTSERIDSLRNEMNARLDSLEKRIPVIFLNRTWMTWITRILQIT